MNDINYVIQNIIQLKNSGGNPQAILQMMMQNNPQTKQILTQLQNMSRGQTPRDFIAQLARQNGVSEQNIYNIQQILQK